MMIKRMLMAAGVAAAATAAGLAAMPAATAHQVTAHQVTAHRVTLAVIAATANHCPPSAKGALPLQASGVQLSADQALAEAATLYKGLNTTGAEVLAGDRSAFAGARGREVRYLCGETMAARTVVVTMRFPKMLPSASLSQGVVFVARFPRGYKVWYIAH
jgi:hypothetical protein